MTMSKHPRTILKYYRMFLMGLSGEEEVIRAGISTTEIQKAKDFHHSLQDGKPFYIAGVALGIDKHIAKRMLRMFEEWKEGAPISYDPHSLTEHPRITYCFSLILDGATDEELKEKCTEYENEKAKKFMNYVDSDMLSSTIARETGLLRSTVKSLLKIYRDRQSAVSLPTGEQPTEGIAVSER
jgi:hypothetical protein